MKWGKVGGKMGGKGGRIPVKVWKEGESEGGGANAGKKLFNLVGDLGAEKGKNRVGVGEIFFLLLFFKGGESAMFLSFYYVFL